MEAGADDDSDGKWMALSIAKAIQMTEYVGILLSKLIIFPSENCVCKGKRYNLK